MNYACTEQRYLHEDIAGFVFVLHDLAHLCSRRTFRLQTWASKWGLLPVSLFLLAKWQYSSVRGAQKSVKLQKTAPTQTGVASRLCGRWKQHELKDKTGAALRSGERKVALCAVFRWSWQRVLPLALFYSLEFGVCFFLNVPIQSIVFGFRITSNNIARVKSIKSSLQHRKTTTSHCKSG